MTDAVWPWRLPLSRGLFALVDEDDYERAKHFKWTASVGGRGCYAVLVKGPNGAVPLHRFVLDAPDGSIVDHRDRDGLNNRRSNLRFCSAAQNCANRSKQLGPTTSRFKGVYFEASSGRWRVEIKKDNRKTDLGRYDSERSAALQYDRAARLMFGSFACTNQSLGLYDDFEEVGLSQPLLTKSKLKKTAWRAEMERLGISAQIA